MTHLKSLIAIGLFLFISHQTYSQGLENVISTLKRQIIGKTYTRHFTYRISQATYLGTIKNKKGFIRFYVVKEFYKIQAANVYHGHSRIVFFDRNKKKYAETTFAMPEDLPFKVEKNALCFKYSIGGVTKIHKESITDNLPTMICGSPSSGCESVIKF